MKITEFFRPHEKLADELMPHAIGSSDDASHDASHLLRVWKNVQNISELEGGDSEVLAAATILHDCVDVPKDSPSRSAASHLASKKAIAILAGLGWQKDRSALVGHAIEAHSFSARIDPTTIEAKILQDADRLDAIGYVGIARCFFVSGRLGKSIYEPEDPIGANRPLDELAYAIDHFQTKLLRLSGSFQTLAGKALAEKRHEVVQKFMDGFVAEVSPDSGHP